MLGILTTIMLFILAILLIININWEVLLGCIGVIFILVFLADQYSNHVIKEDEIQNKNSEK